MADGIEFGSALDWLNESPTDNEQPTTGNDAAVTVALQGAENLPEAKAAEGAPAAQPDSDPLTTFNELTQGIGGLTGLKSTAPLLQGIFEPDPAKRVDAVLSNLQALLPEETVKAIGGKLLSGDQDALWRLVDNNQDALIDHFIQEHGEKVRAKLGVAAAPDAKAKPADDEDDPWAEDDDEQPDVKLQGAEANAEAERLKQENAELQRRLAALEGNKTDEDARAARIALVKEVETDAFAGVVNEAFSQLEDWDEDTMREALEMAQGFYGKDPNAVAAFRSALEFKGKPGYEVFKANAHGKFAQYLGQAITAVGAIRSAKTQEQPSGAPPPRKEFGTGEPAPNRAISNKSDDPFADLAARVNARLAAGQ